jgi:hypothetical protein
MSSYISTARIATARRLKEIHARLYDGVSETIVWRYVFDYVYSADTNRSLLRSVTQFTSDNKQLPKQTFHYQNSQGGTQ